MRKCLVAALILTALFACALPALAAPPDECLNAAKAHLPADARLRESERDGDAWEMEFTSASERRDYEIEIVEGTLLARKITWDAMDLRGSEKQTATEAQAIAVVTAVYPQARIDGVTIDIDGGRYEYEIAYAIENYAGVAELSAGNCAWLGNELVYTGVSSADAADGLDMESAKQLALAQAGGGVVTEIERDTEHGRAVYEGEVLLNGMEYEFEIDAATGEFLKWKVERAD